MTRHHPVFDPKWTFADQYVHDRELIALGYGEGSEDIREVRLDYIRKTRHPMDTLIDVPKPRTRIGAL